MTRPWRTESFSSKLFDLLNVAFPLNDYNYFDGKYEESPIQQSTYFKSCAWPNDYIPPNYDTPPVQLSEEENNEASVILTQMETFGEQMQAAFIAGEKSMDEWDASMNEFKQYDYQKVLDIYNAAAKRIVKQ